MIKYKGKFRVVCEWDRNNLDPIKDDTYVICRGSGQIYRVSEELLAYYKPKKGNSVQFAKKLIDLGVKSLNNCSTDGDILIQFNESSFAILADVVGASSY